jgi:6-pyruvoyltetrahydropterin/6-carboxytetrahydropterin synthase
MLIHHQDSLYETLQMHTARTGEVLRLKVLDFPSTVENLCFQLFSEITALGFRLNRIELRETDTSVIEYSREDWIEDDRRFSSVSHEEESAKSGT